MKTSRLLCYLLIALTSLYLRGADSSIPDIPYKQFVLKNGLTLIVHEDHKAPIVAVNVWYHVGSKNEKKGKTGFAHLFEHLMFNGSENFNDDYFKALEKVGATDLNGTTNEDRTNYFQNVPKAALDFALWMESDRMGHMIGAITQAKLDEQRGVVQNEKRQGENRPYAISRELIQHNTWPVGHPYSWTVIGSMDDLNAASLDDVKDWFKTYYGAANATLVVAGDVNADEALSKVEKYFGDIPSGPPVSRHSAFIAKRTGTHRMQAQDRVPQARIYKVWNIPQYGSIESHQLSLASDVLATGKNSRLYKRLVYDEQLATEVNAYVDPGEIAGQFVIQASARAGVPLAKVEQALDEELARFLASGPSDEELARAKVQNEAAFVRGIERIGGFGGKSDILASNSVFTGKPDYYKVELANLHNATPAQVLATSKEWLSDGQFILEILPFPAYATVKTDTDRSKLPVPELKADAVFPKIERSTLSNGLTVLFVQRHAIPIIDLQLLVKAGYSTDISALPGTAKLAMDMLDEGTTSRSSLQISQELDSLGSNLGTGCNLDVGYVSLNTLKAQLDKSLDIFADVILHPSFPEADFKRLQKQKIALIQREKVDPNSMALRVMPGLLYGDKHPYGMPFTGSGDESSVARISLADMRSFHATWFRPNNATLIIVGDTSLEEIVQKLEARFKTWKAGSVPEFKIPVVETPQNQRIYILDKPGAQQSVIIASLLTVPKSNPDEIAIEMMNEVLGGSFTSRVNMNLREDKHWSYGTRSYTIDTRAQRPFMCIAPIQGDKTREAMLEIQREFSEVAGSRPPTEQELNKVVRDTVLGLSGSWETMDAISGSLGQIVRFGLSDDYFQTYSGKVEALKPMDLAKAARTVVQPGKLTWVIVGDRAKIEAGIRALNLGEVQLLGADGKPQN
jgi:zinc protease